MRVPLTLALLALLTGCGHAAVSSGPAATSRPLSERPAVSAVATVPDATPSEATAPPSAPPAVTGTPAFTYTVPAGWRLVQQDQNQVDIAAGGASGSAERIRLTRDAAQEQTSGMSTTSVDGHPAYIARDGPSDDHSTYTRVWLIADGGGYYELLCSGYAGYDQGRLLSGCDAFTKSIRFAQ